MQRWKQSLPLHPFCRDLCPSIKDTPLLNDWINDTSSPQNGRLSLATTKGKIKDLSFNPLNSGIFYANLKLQTALGMCSRFLKQTFPRMKNLLSLFYSLFFSLTLSLFHTHTLTHVSHNNQELFGRRLSADCDSFRAAIFFFFLRGNDERKNNWTVKIKDCVWILLLSQFIRLGFFSSPTKYRRENSLAYTFSLLLLGWLGRF